MSIFEKANGVSVYNGTFTSGKNIYIDQRSSEPSKSMEIFEKWVAFGALHNAAERGDPPKCHRAAVLSAIEQWAQDPRSPSTVLWLRGAAGAGKTAIAQTLAERWSKGPSHTQLLAASFFFRRRYRKGDRSTLLVPTLTYQLSVSIPATKLHIERAAEDDIGLFEKNLDTQFTKLIIEPLLAICSDEEISAQRVIILDGLDECRSDLPHATHEEQQRDILEAIASTSSLNIPIKFLVTSRPERQIRESFAEYPLDTSTYQLVLDNTFNPKADVQLFLQCRFYEIKQRNEFLRGLPGATWPPEGTIEYLVRKSSGHFIYPSTVIRYINAPRTDPRQRLKTVLGICAASDQTEAPFAEVDRLYRHILRSVAPESHCVVRDILESLCYDVGSGSGAFPGIEDLSPTFLEKLQFIPGGQIYMHLTDLHSILDIPSPEHAAERPIQFIHASFGDFLMDESRSGEFASSAERAALCHYYNWFKHLLILSSRTQAGLASEYNEDEIRNSVTLDLSFLCPPSKEMKVGLEAAMDRSHDRYNQYLWSIHMEHLISPEHRLVLLDTLKPDQYIEVLRYLLKRNTKAIEPSYIRRWTNSRWLSRQLALMDRPNPELLASASIPSCSSSSTDTQINHFHAGAQQWLATLAIVATAAAIALVAVIMHYRGLSIMAV